MSALAQPPVAMRQPSRALLAVQGLKIASRIGGVTRTIVADIHLSLAQGETIGIVGESGSGKSMTARALIGLLPQGVFAQGEVTYEGRNLLGLSERQLAGLRGTEIGMILQDPFTMLNPVMRCGRVALVFQFLCHFSSGAVF